MSGLDRREFLALGATASAAIGVGRSPRLTHSTGIGLKQTGSARADGFSERSVAELADRMQKGEISSRQLTQYYLARITAMDKAATEPGRTVNVPLALTWLPMIRTASFSAISGVSIKRRMAGKAGSKLM